MRTLMVTILTMEGETLFRGRLGEAEAALNSPVVARRIPFNGKLRFQLDSDGTPNAGSSGQFAVTPFEWEALK